jgi:hypothetical protein
MTKMNSLLTERFKKASSALSKMTTLVEKSSSGNLSSFSGVFKISALNEKEKETLFSLLTHYKEEEREIEGDLDRLSSLTAEVKAINTQAILLHGERIKKAQELLKHYKEGAFSAWLIATYGNRQTPYNFLQYFELYTALPLNLHSRLDEMPRQAVYSLASRDGALEKKTQIINNYKGQPKQELLQLIRDTFPLRETDNRAYDLGLSFVKDFCRIKSRLEESSFTPTAQQKKQLLQLLKELKTLIETP